jgi:short subunit fatty acids transporter
MGILARAGLAITRWTERWVPDSWVIAVFLTLVVAGLAVGVGGASPAVALDAWGRGLWALLALAMQFTLMMVVSYACAVSPLVKRLFEWMASRPDPERPRQVILLMGLFSTVTAWLNWAFSLGISFVVFRSECHGQNASSMSVDCVIKRLDWRPSPWRHLWCHPLGCLS